MIISRKNYLPDCDKKEEILGFGISNPISFIGHGKSINKFCLCFLFCDFLKLTNTLMPKQAQRIDIILPFYPFELKLYFSSTRPTYFSERRQSQDCSAEKRMGNATGQILHLINIPSLTTYILVYLYTSICVNLYTCTWLTHQPCLFVYLLWLHLVTPRWVSLCEIVYMRLFSVFVPQKSNCVVSKTK